MIDFVNMKISSCLDHSMVCFSADVLTDLRLCGVVAVEKEKLHLQFVLVSQYLKFFSQ